MNGLGRKLTDKENMVFCSLIKYPTKNDRELSEITGINLSTVTAIRRRLEAHNYYNKIRIPMVQHIGAELLTISYGEIDNTLDREKRDELCNQYAKIHDNVFLFLSSDDFAIHFSISKNYTEVKRDVDDLQHFLSKNKILTPRVWHYVMFPFEVSSLINFFDFSYSMSHLVSNTSYKVPRIDLKYKKYDKFNLTNKEKLALAGLVNNPAMADNAIAKDVGLSRQTLSNMRQKFNDIGLVNEINIPNLNIMKGIFVFSHMLFNPDCMLEDRKNGVRYVLESSPTVFLVSGSFESTLIHLVSDYEEYSALKNRLISFYTSKNFLRGEGNIHLMPSKSLKIHKEFDFSGILKNLL
ncbi:MAG: hypothetical protein KKH79_03470 [Candidatus Thermoplasmatota archaeon]|nr:hypothetical protein [Candidatus Thermoplasmatota archaeon]